MRHTENGETVVSNESIEYKKTHPIDVPMIADGAVEGYIVAQFGYTIESKNAKQPTVPPEAFLLDEAFRALYADDRLDFRHLEKFDVTGLTHALVLRVNQRLNADVLKEVLIEEFNYVAKKDISK
jgi:hypothetical protein